MALPKKLQKIADDINKEIEVDWNCYKKQIAKDFNKLDKKTQSIMEETFWIGWTYRNAKE